MGTPLLPPHSPESRTALRRSNDLHVMSVTVDQKIATLRHSDWFNAECIHEPGQLICVVVIDVTTNLQELDDCRGLRQDP